MLDFSLIEFAFLAGLALLILGPKEFIKFMRRMGGLVSYAKSHLEMVNEYVSFHSSPRTEPKAIKHKQDSSPQICDIHLALYQPEIPQNTGTLMRMGACLGVPIDIIEPCSFVWNDQKLKRAGMDYIDLANICRHESWEVFTQTHSDRRIILLDTHGEMDYLNFMFQPTDILLLGQESSGVPKDVFNFCVYRLKIPMVGDARSLNMAIAGGIVVGEALRQLRA
jgi:tRNA (cytidine/uridine-2'-O-)-methyltransferase